jgi:hypothetical protein
MKMMVSHQIVMDNLMRTNRLAHTGGCAGLEGVDVVQENGRICKNIVKCYKSLIWS